MEYLKSAVFSLVLLLSMATLQAQNHTNSWMRATLSIPVKDKFKSDRYRIDAEVQHRRQNGFQNNNLFDKNLAFSFKNWIHYQHSKGLKFSVSPFAYYSNYHIINSEADERANPNSEVRFSAAMEMNHEIVNRLHVVGRSALEYRIFEKHHKDVLRFRNRLGLQYEFNQHWKAVTSMEVLVNLSGVAATHFLDHNRFGRNVEYHPTKSIKLELGYMYISRLRKTNILKIGENTFSLNLTYQLSKRNRD